MMCGPSDVRRIISSDPDGNVLGGTLSQYQTALG